MQPLFTIAEKEFRDQLTSKRFIIILAVLLLLAAYAMATGMDQYNKSLDKYKIDKSAGTPSLLQVFQVFTGLFGFLGMVLGIAMGFDQITKEKESGSLKSVLSAPIYRDTLIVGKAVGSMASLAVAMAITFLVIIAITLFYGVVPGPDDLVRIGLFFIASILYCTTFYAIAMLTSTVSRNSAMAIILAIAIVVAYVVVSMASSMISTPIADAVSGPPPTHQQSAGDNGSNASASYNPYTDPRNHDFKDWADNRIKLQAQISDALNLVSPLYDFTGLGSMYSEAGVYPGLGQMLLSRDQPVSNPMDYYAANKTASGLQPAQLSILGSLAYSWTKALMLIVEALVAFALSYVIFMRMDVR